MVVVLFILMVVVVVAAEWIAARKRRAEATKAVAEALSRDRLSIADGLFYAPGHSRSALDAEGTLAVGADDLLLQLIGRVERVDLPDAGARLERGDPLFTIWNGRRSVTVPSPVSGKVEALNTGVIESPAMLMSARDGWAVRIRPEALADSIDGMSIGAGAREWFDRELARLRDFFADLAMAPALSSATLQDGGMPVRGALGHLDDESLNRFQEEFLCGSE